MAGRTVVCSTAPNSTAPRSRPTQLTSGVAQMYTKNLIRNNSPIHALSLGRTQAPRRPPADVVLIVGPNQDLNLAIEAQRQCAEGKLDTEVIGDALSPIQQSDLINLRRSERLG